MIPNHLMCEYQTEPLAVSRRCPVFTWRVEELPENAVPDGYRLKIATSPEILEHDGADVWDSGEVLSGDTPNIPNALCSTYAGTNPLACFTRYYWCVSVHAGGVWSENSQPASFETGLFDGQPWKGCWIGKPNDSRAVGLFRYEVSLPATAVRARVYLASSGYAQLYVNGHRIGNEVLSPDNADFARHVYYTGFDITGALTAGENVIGVRMARGWSVHPAFRLNGFAELENGETVPFVSDFSHWVFMISPILSATIYSGEVYHSGYHSEAWCLPGRAFSDRYHRALWNIFSDYLPTRREDNPGQYDEYAFAYYDVQELPAPGGTIMGQATEPIRETERLCPRSVERLPDGQFVVDFGQNFSGVVRVRLRGEPYRQVTLNYSEILNEDHTLNMEYLRVSDPTYALPMQCDQLTLVGEEEVYQPEFTYHGFRYVSVAGAQEDFSGKDIVGIAIHSDVAANGRFTCSDPMLNRLQQNILWTERSNLYSIPTDCCQRSERQGWLNDMTARAEATVFNFDVNRFFEKFSRDIADTQDPESGAIADTAPFRRGNRPADPVSSSFLIVCDLLYQHYGNARPIREHYEAMKKWTEYLGRNARDHIVSFSLYGDWASPIANSSRHGITSPISSVTPGDYVSTGYYYMDLCLMARFAVLVNRPEEAVTFSKEAETVRCAILNRFYDKEKAAFAGGSQGSNALALYLDIVPSEDCDRVVACLLEDIEKNDWHLTTGNLMTKYVFEVLSRYGQVDAAYRLMKQKTYPSFGYMIEKGATTVWERWEYETGYGMNSHNHPMYGSVSAWFYRYLAGIEPQRPGYAQARIAPCVPRELAAVDGAVNTPYGELCSAWEQQDGKTVFSVSVPAGMLAQIALPVAVNATIRCADGRLLWQTESPVNGPETAVRTDDRVCFTVPAGRYEWTVG